MNPCQDFEKSLPAYQEGLISGQDKKDLEDHLRSCEPCRLTLRELNRTRDLLGRLQEVEPPPWLTQKVMARVREEAEAKRGLLKKLFYPIHIKIPLEAAASIVLVILAVYVFKATEPEMRVFQSPSTSVPPVSRDFAYREKGPEIAPVPVAPKAPTALEPKTATGGRLEKEQDALQQSGSGALGDKKLEEKSVAAAKSPEQPARKIPKALLANKMGEPGTPDVSLQKMESSESKPALGLGVALKEKDRAQSGVLESSEKKGKLDPDRSTVRQAAVFKSKPMGLTIQVREVQESVQKTLDLLQQAGASNVRRETQVGIDLITASVAPQAIPKLLDQLNTLGEVWGNLIPPPSQEGPVAIRIEIRPVIP